MTHNLELQDVIREHKRTIQRQEWHEASLAGQKVAVAPPYPIAGMDTVCDTCGESYTDGNDTTCNHCQHRDCKERPCQECTEIAMDRAMDMADMER
jgi:hypothetical protein